MKYSVGVDIGKKDFKACIVLFDQEVKVKASRTFTNTTKGFEQFWVWVSKHNKGDIRGHITMEATGVYHERLSWYLYEKDIALSIVLPNRSKAYLVSLGHKSKNDKMDAKGLATMGAYQNLVQWKPISKNIYILRSLTRHLEDLQQTRTTLLNQFEACKYNMFEVKEVKNSLSTTIKAIEKQILKCKQKITKTIENDPELNNKIKYMTSIKGVSILTAAVLIAETNGFALITNANQLISYAGYDVKENQSGQTTGKSKISKKGNAHIRRAMHLPAFNMVRYKIKSFNDLYNRVYSKSGCKMKAYVAIQAKLLRTLYALWKKEEMFDQNYVNINISSVQEAKYPIPGSGDLQEQKQIATALPVAILGGHPSVQSAEVPIPVLQI